MTMNPEIKAMWVKALRSGDYYQGTDYLAVKREGFAEHCCLGVLCEIAKAQGIVAEKTHPAGPSIRVFYNPNRPEGDFEHRSLPVVVQEWAGLTELHSSNPLVRLPDYIDPSDVPNMGYDPKNPSVSLAELNDDRVPFDTIARVIEDQL